MATDGDSELTLLQVWLEAGPDGRVSPTSTPQNLVLAVRLILRQGPLNGAAALRLISVETPVAFPPEHRPDQVVAIEAIQQSRCRRFPSWQEVRPGRWAS